MDGPWVMCSGIERLRLRSSSGGFHADQGVKGVAEGGGTGQSTVTPAFIQPGELVGGELEADRRQQFLWHS